MDGPRVVLLALVVVNAELWHRHRDAALGADTSQTYL
jgi:hypothetical protein